MLIVVAMFELAAWETTNFAAAQGPPPTADIPLIHDGLYAAKVTNISESVAFMPDTGFDTNDAKIDVTGLATVNVSWWMRSGTETDSTLFSVGIAPFDSDQEWLGPTYGQSNLVAGDNIVGTDWEFRSGEYVIPDPEVIYINLDIRVMPGDSVVVDDFKIVDTAAPGVNLLANGSFEDWGAGGLVGAAADAVADNGVADSWRFFAVAGAQAVLERVGGTVTNVQEGQYSAKVTRTKGRRRLGFRQRRP
ncbi:unnamed protein product [marine sediment metagenome]|uniref:Uncharacterized protein n=1 Tax=marine sediment metagenome TaxID=412755 RepID=X1RXZ2_9ZZZZ